MSFYACLSDLTCPSGKLITSPTMCAASLRDEGRETQAEFIRSRIVMSHFRVAIIGCGRMGSEHARASALSGARICLVYDPDVSRAQMLADKYPASIVLRD